MFAFGVSILKSFLNKTERSDFHHYSLVISHFRLIGITLLLVDSQHIVKIFAKTDK